MNLIPPPRALARAESYFTYEKKIRDKNILTEIVDNRQRILDLYNKGAQQEIRDEFPVLTCLGLDEWIHRMKTCGEHLLFRVMKRKRSEWLKQIWYHLVLNNQYYVISIIQQRSGIKMKHSDELIVPLLIQHHAMDYFNSVPFYRHRKKTEIFVEPGVRIGKDLSHNKH